MSRSSRCHRGFALNVMIGTFMIYSMADAQNHNNSSAVCGHFPHTNLYCGEYIDTNTVVYVDTDVFNYTEINNALRVFHDGGLFGRSQVPNSSCRPQIVYMICQYVYPRCDNDTQALLPVCEDICSEYTENCIYAFRALPEVARVRPIAESFIVNCTNQFSAFGSVNFDTENCYDFYLVPTFTRSTVLAGDNTDGRLIVIPDRDTYTPYCSEFQRRPTTVTCSARGNPQPTIEIFKEYDNGSWGTFQHIFQSEDEVAVKLNILDYGESVKIHCLATNIVTTLNFSINLTYTCCSDDTRNMQYSLGQEFMTSNCCQCLCGNGGNISCNMATCRSMARCELSTSESGVPAGVIVAIIVVVILVIVGVIIAVIFITRWYMKKKYAMKENVIRHKSIHHTVAFEDQKSKSDSGKVLLTSVDVSQEHEHTESNDNVVDVQHVEKEKSEKRATDPGVLSASSINDLLTACEEEEFQSTLEIITNAMNDHHLGGFIKSHDCLTIHKTLGEGAFGKVFYGQLKDEADDSNLEVAVKTMKDCSSMDELNSFISESVIMKDFKHRNVLGLVGVSVGVEEDKAVPYIILPFMANGDLKRYLKDKRTAAGRDVKALFKEINYLTLVRMCCDVCNGMKYLASIKFVHRDLAARNCMVDKDLVIKVADFGLARDIYAEDYYRLGHTAKVPVKWMPPESIHDRYYDQKTDVWSFGVVCWEVFSLGKLPYAGLDNQNIVQYIESEKRLSKPALCSSEMYQVMSSCWQLKNNDRPVFSTLVEQLEQHYCDVMESNPSDPSSPYHNLFDESVYINWKPE
ncbi:hepatocyte growth factor receptor-like isoform X3 [Dysidea avara]|uniref:hepatocyte growth factor receptor-like isoform X3 n=1 Tax=Dysidea avara TaxID=196820 RepID=UPI0033214BC0